MAGLYSMTAAQLARVQFSIQSQNNSPLKLFVKRKQKILDQWLNFGPTILRSFEKALRPTDRTNLMFQWLYFHASRQEP